MIRAALHAEVRAREDGEREVLSPAVGDWRGHPREGAVIGAGEAIGEIVQLGVARRVVLPEAMPPGRVRAVPADRVVPVEFGAVLFSLRALEGVEASAPVATDAGTGVGGTGYLVPSPTDGVFYRRAAPDAPPFTDVGQRIRVGQPVGLVEVMKTFNQILYGGDSFPDEAEVVEFFVTDGEDVRAGQPLLRVR